MNRGLVESPEQWAWSSFRSYAFGEKGRVRVNFQKWTAKIKMRKREEFGGGVGCIVTIDWGTLVLSGPPRPPAFGVW